MEYRPEYIDCFIIPLFEGNLLLPQSMVIEVVSRGEQPLAFKPALSAPAWLKGSFMWREQRLPVVSLAHDAQSLQETRIRITRFLVVHNLHFDAAQPTPSPPFYAIEVRGIPHPIKISYMGVRLWDEPVQDYGVIAMRVKASGVVCTIPNFERITDLLTEYPIDLTISS